jgi:thiamine kinase-like enzyme
MNITFNNLDKIIDKGRESTVYDLNDSQVLKLYNENFDKGKIFEEYKNTLQVWKLKTDFKVAKPIEFVFLNNSYGIIFEKIEGDSLMNLMMKNLFNFFPLSKKVAIIHRELHLHEIKLISQEEKFGELIKGSSHFSKKEIKKLLSILKEKHEPVLCHGDFHHGNILKTKNNQYYVIDWMDAFSGAKELDIALTAVNSMISQAPNHVPKVFRTLYSILKTVLKLDSMYLNNYGISKNSMNKYLYLASAIHLVQSNGIDTGHLEYFKKIGEIVKDE